MLWNDGKIYQEDPFELERDLEDAILQVSTSLFGPKRIYLDAKRKIGAKNGQRNIPDGYLLDLSSVREPKLYVVENELAAHDPLRHIAVQILQFSLSYENSESTVKKIVKDALQARPEALEQCKAYARENGFDNIDYLLERAIFGPGKFNALVIIDELDEELEKVLISRFKFPVEILTLQRYKGPQSERVYQFQPFLDDVTFPKASGAPQAAQIDVDPSEIDTVVVPAQEQGFLETFIGENRWHHIRIHSSMIPKIKYIAAYRVAPESAITHIAAVKDIEQWQDTRKYVLNFSSPAEKINPIKLVTGGKNKAPQAPRYTTKAKLDAARNLDEAF